MHSPNNGLPPQIRLSSQAKHLHNLKQAPPYVGVKCQFSLHGAIVRVVLPPSVHKDALYSSLPLGISPEVSGKADVVYCLDESLRLFRDSELRLRAPSIEDALRELVSDVHFQLAFFARDALYVHASVVAIGGSAIVFPGRSFSGKSTLAAELVKAGALYFSDEFAVFDTRGRVHPYIKPISLRDRDGVGRLFRAETLGGSCGSAPLPVALIVYTRYKTGANWEPRSLTTGKALLAMVDNTVRARDNPEMMLQTLAKVARSANAIESDRGEARKVIADIVRHHAESQRPKP